MNRDNLIIHGERCIINETRKLWSKNGGKYDLITLKRLFEFAGEEYYNNQRITPEEIIEKFNLILNK